MIFLPQNPCCTPVVTPVYAACEPCTAQPIPTNSVSYSGPNLPCTQIHTCDTVTVSLQKIDEQICILKQQIVNLQSQIDDC